MSENRASPIVFAVIADVHGNRWALEAVLQDIDRRGIHQIVNLGDHLTGLLDPAGTGNLLMARENASASISAPSTNSEIMVITPGQ
jgi:predicted phosphodiesterase